jgi:hypothetical protein
MTVSFFSSQDYVIWNVTPKKSEGVKLEPRIEIILFVERSPQSNDANVPPKTIRVQG